MCIILVRSKTMEVDPGVAVEMRAMGNRDGAGAMWVEDGRVKTKKIARPTEKEVRELFESLMDKDMAFHVRNQSMGTISEVNTHPFCVTSKDDGHERDIYMMHNGTIRDIQVERDKADSYNLAVHFLRPFLIAHPDALQEVEFLKLLAGWAGMSKLVFLDDLNRFTVVNSNLGGYHKSGAWVSTKVSIDPRPVKSTGNFPQTGTTQTGGTTQKMSHIGCSTTDKGTTNRQAILPIGAGWTPPDPPKRPARSHDPLDIIFHRESDDLIHFQHKSNGSGAITVIERNGQYVDADTGQVMATIVEDNSDYDVWGSNIIDMRDLAKTRPTKEMLMDMINEDPEKVVDIMYDHLPSCSTLQ